MANVKIARHKNEYERETETKKRNKMKYFPTKYLQFYLVRHHVTPSDPW